MTESELLDCARALVFQGEDEYYPIWLSGTCFVFSYRGYGFLCTARHCLKNGHAAPNHIQVHADQTYTDLSLPLDQAIEIQPTKDVLLEESRDVFLARVAADQCTEQQGRVVGAVDLGRYRIRGYLPNEGQEIITAGFPLDKRFRRLVLEGDVPHFSHRRVCLRGTYDEPAPDKTRHFVTLRNPGLQTVDGFSGSPVFCTVRAHDEGNEVVFLGVIIDKQLEDDDGIQFKLVSHPVVFSAMDTAISHWEGRGG